MNDLERPLLGLQPVAGTLDRERMLFEAGRASARGEGLQRLLLAASALLLVGVIGLAGLFVNERSRRQALEIGLTARDREQERSPTPTLPDPSPTFEASTTSYLALSRHVRPEGLDDPSPLAEILGAERTAGSTPTIPIRVRDAQAPFEF
ncbi:hypothetical protein [Singulisphaera sp. PoT]|uniref:hypothetical protein n=1 Tax=Singulisphaera sp. PoT TaxID=3411797 RepID=UPI003BF5C9D7